MWEDKEPWRGGPGEAIRRYLHSHTVEEFNERYRTDEDFREMAEQIYHSFDELPAGKYVMLDYDEETLPLVLLTFIAYFNEPPHFLEFYMSDDYTRILREKLPEGALEWLRKVDGDTHTATPEGHRKVGAVA